LIPHIANFSFWGEATASVTFFTGVPLNPSFFLPFSWGCYSFLSAVRKLRAGDLLGRGRLRMPERTRPVLDRPGFKPG
jgi:hypothetical protein